MKPFHEIKDEWEMQSLKVGDKVFIPPHRDKMYKVKEVYSQVVMTECGEKFAKYWLRYWKTC